VTLRAGTASEDKVMAGREKPRPEAGDGYLVDRARDGYLDAYEMLVQRHSAMAYRVALRLCGNHHDAQDIAQDALIAAWENLARFKGGSSFSTWLYQIVTRRALNKITRGRSRRSRRSRRSPRSCRRSRYRARSTGRA
jgi:DNA-directed RNA polymerase specialized sigma24 family protein